MHQFSDMYFGRLPPTDASDTAVGAVLHQVQNQVTGAAANFDWTAAFTSASIPIKGSVLLYIQSQASDASIRFKSTNSAAATTANNGVLIPAKTGQVFRVDPISHRFIDVFGSGAGTIQVQIISSELTRRII